MGCRTDEVTSALLAQIAALEHPTHDTPEPALDALAMQAFAMLAELNPQSATEAFLAVQMIGAQRMAVRFLERAGREG